MPLTNGAAVDFVDGLQTMCGAGSPSMKDGVAIHMYACNTPMGDRAFCDADGELLVVPQLGVLRVTTEMGRLRVSPGEIFVVPRNLRFTVDPEGEGGDGSGDMRCRGYVLEVFASRGFVLPDLGPLGANGLAEPRDFLMPAAWYEDRACPEGFVVTTKYAGELFDCRRDFSPYDVVAWHGNYAPYKYDLSRFHAINTVSCDHPDPSIFTVLTSPSETAGTANIDFVIFPERWMVADNTFRPPWYHMNIMSEFMGLIYGVYDAKPQGFVPGGISLHNCMLPHGPDRDAFEHASNGELKPVKLTGTMAFMFETRFPQRVTRHAATSSTLQDDYSDCWKGLEKRFDPTRP